MAVQRLQQTQHKRLAACEEQRPWHTYYQRLLARRSDGGCPALLLAPMENLADRPCRLALQRALGGDVFDEACTEFIRVPRSSDSPWTTVKGITRGYSATELGQVPLAAQLMGSNTELLVLAGRRLVQLGAPRIDLNCGCPANVVTGGGAGSSLLKDPGALHSIVAALVATVGDDVPVSVKMRSGFADTGLFRDNLRAVQDAGASFVTIHPRTKEQGYGGAADWALIAQAKQLLSIPVVGNGDVVSVQSALSLLDASGCDALMIGRGALQDPLLFRRIRAHFAQASSQPAEAEDSSSDQACEAAIVECFLRCYASYGFDGRLNGALPSQAGRIGRLKKIMRYVFSSQHELRQASARLIKVPSDEISPACLLEALIQQVRLYWREGGPADHVLVNHYTMGSRGS